MMTDTHTAKSGFTLLEVLFAITIAGGILAAASAMLVSVTNIWASRQEVNFFEDHVDGVAEFVQACFTNAGVEITLSDADSDSTATDPSNNEETGNEGNNTRPRVEVSVGNANSGSGGTRNANESGSTSSSSSLLRTSETPVSWAKPPGFADFRDPYLNFKLKDSPPLLVNMDDAPIVGIDAYLHFEQNEGLSLLWYSILQEEVDDENDLRRTLVSPYVKGLKYIYWDERFEKWEEADEPKEGEADEFLLPRFIKIIFEHDEVIKERTITIPVPSRSAVLF